MVDGAGQGSCQSQGGASLTGAQATVWIPENQAPRFGQNHSKVTVLGHPDQPIPGAEEVISHGTMGEVYQPTALGLHQAQKGHPKGTPGQPSHDLNP